MFGVIGWFLVKAAVQFDPHDAVSIGGALAQLTYGLFGFVQARYHPRLKEHRKFRPGSGSL